MNDYLPKRIIAAAAAFALAAAMLLAAAGCSILPEGQRINTERLPAAAAPQPGTAAQPAALRARPPVPGVSEITDFRQVPGITQEDVAAVEELLRQGTSFTYGTTPSTESFLGEDGEIHGFSNLFCQWLADFFGITVTLRLYEWGELIAGLESGEIDFTGELTATPGRRETYYMTDAIEGRSVVHLRTAGSAPLSHIASFRPLRLGFLSGTTTIDEVAAQFSGEYEAFIVESYEEAYALLETGQIDSFVEEQTAQAAFDVYGGVVPEPFFPLIHGPVSLATQKEANAPVINIVQKALERTDLRDYLSQLYHAGMAQYKKHKLFMSLTEEELAYIGTAQAIPFAAEYDNYPVSFYNTREHQWQGIFFDVLREVEDLTGLTFEQTVREQAEWAALLEMLENGEVRLLSELIRTPEREGRFLWTDTSLLVDYYALLSKSEEPHVKINEVWYKSVGLVAGTAHEQIFDRWFANHPDTVRYTSFDESFEALKRGDVGMVMASRNQLLMMTNLQELVGYKTNIIFNYPLHSVVGFYKGDEVLRGIFEKALQQVDTQEIELYWTSKTYDYTAQLALARLPGLVGIMIMLIAMIVSLTALFKRSRNAQILAVENEMLSDLYRTKTQFLQDMRHEMRAPLTVIATGIDVVDHIVGKEKIDVERAQSAIDTVREETQRLGRMITGMLTVASMSELGGNRKRVNITDLILSTAKAADATLNDNRLGIVVEPGLPDVFVEYDRIKQVMTNLLNNSSEHTKGGKITIEVKRSGQFIEVAVSDTGSGIAPNVLPWVFERGVSGRDSTGYGLYICKAVVEAHGGEIDIESNRGEGTTVRFTVPVYAGQEAGHEHTEKSENAQQPRPAD